MKISENILSQNSNLKWLATGLSILGGIMVGLNITSITRYGFVPFLFSSVIWLVVGYKMKENSIVVLNAAFVVVNMIGVYRWLLH